MPPEPFTVVQEAFLEGAGRRVERCQPPHENQSLYVLAVGLPLAS